VTELRTERLLLRRWRATDRAPFARMNADPEVMRYFPAPLTTEPRGTCSTACRSLRPGACRTA
jgi:RimJ/RimL family protein N-acetyltransferase